MTIERDIGRLEAEVKALKDSMARIEPKIDTAVNYITATKATKRTILTMSSIAGSIGAGIVTAAAALLEHLKP